MSARRFRIAKVSAMLFVSFLAATPVLAVEHPGTVHQEDNCNSCHAAKTTGKSVHSAMTISCTVCHVAQTQGDMTTLTLLMPKERICSACHDTTSELRKHQVKVEGFCLDCHDAHSSDRRMLLRAEADPSSVPPPSPARAHKLRR